MNKNLHDKVTAIASKTRAWVETEAKHDMFNAESLCGWCAIASAELHKQLLANGITAAIHVWDDKWVGCHCFCVVEDYVVDITATQFSQFKNDKVVIMHIKEAEAHEMYCTVKTFTNSKSLRRWQTNQGWPSKQIAFA